jgi:hypothetical protein
MKTRMFRYPCSFLIYSAQFDGLPAAVKDRVFRRMYDLLSAADPGPAYSRLSTSDRRRVLEILLDTKQNLPAYWKRPSGE